MRQIKLWMLAAILIICGTAAFASCMANDDNPAGQVVESQYIPQAPDYSDPTMWITEDGDADSTGADIFYVVSTWEDDWTTADGKVCHYADVWNPEHHVLVATNYSASEYPPFRGFLNVGDIHSCEPWLYSECLARNIAVRAREWISENVSENFK